MREHYEIHVTVNCSNTHYTKYAIGRTYASFIRFKHGTRMCQRDRQAGYREICRNRRNYLRSKKRFRLKVNKNSTWDIHDLNDTMLLRHLHRDFI